MTRLIRNGSQKPLSPARPDGRPQYYDIAEGDRVQCYVCMKNGVAAQHKQGEGFMADPANSPANDGGVYTICHAHLPDNAVIYNNVTGMCRNKAGDNNWKEI